MDSTINNLEQDLLGHDPERYELVEVCPDDLRNLIAQTKQAALCLSEAIAYAKATAPQSCGQCGSPNACCDMDCMNAAYINEQIWKWEKALAAIVKP